MTNDGWLPRFQLQQFVPLNVSPSKDRNSIWILSPDLLEYVPTLTAAIVNMTG